MDWTAEKLKSVDLSHLSLNDLPQLARSEFRRITGQMLEQVRSRTVTRAGYVGMLHRVLDTFQQTDEKTIVQAIYESFTKSFDRAFLYLRWALTHQGIKSLYSPLISLLDADLKSNNAGYRCLFSAVWECIGDQIGTLQAPNIPKTSFLLMSATLVDCLDKWDDPDFQKLEDVMCSSLQLSEALFYDGWNTIKRYNVQFNYFSEFENNSLMNVILQCCWQRRSKGQGLIASGELDEIVDATRHKVVSEAAIKIFEGFPGIQGIEKTVVEAMVDLLLSKNEGEMRAAYTRWKAVSAPIEYGDERVVMAMMSAELPQRLIVWFVNQIDLIELKVLNQEQQNLFHVAALGNYQDVFEKLQSRYGIHTAEVGKYYLDSDGKGDLLEDYQIRDANGNTVVCYALSCSKHNLLQSLVSRLDKESLLNLLLSISEDDWEIIAYRNPNLFDFLKSWLDVLEHKQCLELYTKRKLLVVAGGKGQSGFLKTELDRLFNDPDVGIDSCFDVLMASLQKTHNTCLHIASNAQTVQVLWAYITQFKAEQQKILLLQKNDGGVSIFEALLGMEFLDPLTRNAVVTAAIKVGVVLDCLNNDAGNIIAVLYDKLLERGCSESLVMMLQQYPTPVKGRLSDAIKRSLGSQVISVRDLNKVITCLELFRYASVDSDFILKYRLNGGAWILDQLIQSFRNNKIGNNDLLARFIRLFSEKNPRDYFSDASLYDLCKLTAVRGAVRGFQSVWEWFHRDRNVQAIEQSLDIEFNTARWALLSTESRLYEMVRDTWRQLGVTKATLSYLDTGSLNTLLHELLRDQQNPLPSSIQLQRAIGLLEDPALSPETRSQLLDRCGHGRISVFHRVVVRCAKTRELGTLRKILGFYPDDDSRLRALGQNNSKGRKLFEILEKDGQFDVGCLLSELSLLDRPGVVDSAPPISPLGVFPRRSKRPRVSPDDITFTHITEPR